MRWIRLVIGVGVLGCLVACGGPILLLLAGGMAAGAAVTELLQCYRDWLSISIGSAIALTLATIAAYHYVARRRAKVLHPSIPGAPKVEKDQSTLSVACTLSPGAFEERLTELHALTRDELLSACQDDLILRLRYRLEAEAKVRRMVEKERECCAFLTFTLQRRASELELQVTAPEVARQAVDRIYEQYIR